MPELAFGEYWDTCEYTDGVLNYNQVPTAMAHPTALILRSFQTLT